MTDTPKRIIAVDLGTEPAMMVAIVRALHSDDVRLLDVAPVDRHTCEQLDPTTLRMALESKATLGEPARNRRERRAAAARARGRGRA